MLENIQGDSWGSIPPLRMPSLLPHDLCHGRSSSRWLQARYPVKLLVTESSLTPLCNNTVFSWLSASVTPSSILMHAFQDYWFNRMRTQNSKATISTINSLKSLCIFGGSSPSLEKVHFWVCSNREKLVTFKWQFLSFLSSGISVHEPKAILLFNTFIVITSL